MSGVICDVLVVGGGTAGVPAAVAAARAGARTLLIERADALGGLAVRGLHRYVCGLYLNGGSQRPSATLHEGLVREIVERIVAPGSRPVAMGKVWLMPYRRAALAETFRALAAAEGNLEVRCGAAAVSAATGPGGVSEVVVEQGGRREAIWPRAVVDCSGDGVMLAWTGAPFETTPIEQRQLAGFTVRLKGVGPPMDMLPLLLAYHMGQAVRKKGFPEYLRFTSFVPGEEPDEGYCKVSLPPDIGPDPVAQARAAADRVCGYLAAVLPAFRQARIVECSPEVSDREGPCLRGDYVLTADDALNARRFEDGVVKNAWPIELWDRQRGPTYAYGPLGEYYEIPLRCLTAASVRNVWWAGRCISVTREALGSTRVMGPCMALGEAAGREAARWAKAQA